MISSPSPSSSDAGANQWLIDTVAIVTSFTALTLLRCATAAILDCVRRRRRRTGVGQRSMTSSSYGSNDEVKRLQPIGGDANVIAADKEPTREPNTEIANVRVSRPAQRRGQNDRCHQGNERTCDISADLLYGILAVVASGYIINCIRSGDQPPFSPALSPSSPPSSAWMTQQLVIRVTICCAVGRCMYDIVRLLRRARTNDAWLKLTHETDIVLHVVTVQMLALMLVTGEDTLLALLAPLYQIILLFKACHTLVLSLHRLHCLIPVCSALWIVVAIGNGIILPASFLLAGILTESPLVMSGVSQIVLLFTVTVFTVANIVTVWRIHCYFGVSSHRLIFNLFLRRNQTAFASNAERQELISHA